MKQSVSVTFTNSGSKIPSKRHINPDGSEGAWVPVDAIIEDDVWLGAGVVVMPGTHVKSGTKLLESQIIDSETSEH